MATQDEHPTLGSRAVFGMLLATVALTIAAVGQATAPGPAPSAGAPGCGSSAPGTAVGVAAGWPGRAGACPRPADP